MWAREKKKLKERKRKSKPTLWSQIQVRAMLLVLFHELMVHRRDGIGKCGAWKGLFLQAGLSLNPE